MASVLTAPSATAASPGLFKAPRSTRNVVWRKFRRHPAALAGSAVLLIVIGISLLAPLAPYDPEAIDVANRRQPPSVTHVMGTDRNGRDVFSRLLYGGRISLVVGFLAVTTAVVIGTTVGTLAGHFGGAVDQLLMRLTDLFLCFPHLFVLILLSFLLAETRLPIFQGGIGGIILVIGTMSWMAIARMVRASALAVKQREFVAAARASGASDLRIAVVHILPNTVSPIIVYATMGVAWAILTESSLSFLGYGIQPPVASWGNMLSDAQAFIILTPWLAIFPGFMIFITVLSINFIGDALRDALDPYKV